jgi:hypothetical protein
LKQVIDELIVIQKKELVVGFLKKKKELEEKAGGIKVSVGNIENGRTTNVSPEKIETKENKEHVYEQRNVDDSGQIHGRTNGKMVCRKNSK